MNKKYKKTIIIMSLVFFIILYVPLAIHSQVELEKELNNANIQIHNMKNQERISYENGYDDAVSDIIQLLFCQKNPSFMECIGVYLKQENGILPLTL